MSFIQDIKIDNSMPDQGYRIQNIERCRLVFGSVPINDFEMLLHGFSKKAVMAIDIADRLGATFVFGEPDDIERLKALDLPVSEKRQRDANAAIKAMVPDNVVDWLLKGERGKSSNTLCHAFYGIPFNNDNDYPRDPSDLRRCLAFLELLPIQKDEMLKKMKAISPEWEKIVGQWDGLVSSYADELSASKKGEMPKTNGLMQSILGF